jgi:hypothetical protein
MRNAIPIEVFKIDEIKSLRKSFLEKKLGGLLIDHYPDKETGETVFRAKLKEKEEFEILSKSKDPHHAKDKRADNFVQNQDGDQHLSAESQSQSQPSKWSLKQLKEHIMSSG